MNWHPVRIIPKFCDCSCYQILGILVLSLKCLPEQRVKVHFAADSCFLWLRTVIFTFITWLAYFRWDHGHCCLPLAIIQFKWTESDKHNGTIFHYSFTFNFCADVHVVTTLGLWSLWTQWNTQLDKVCPTELICWQEPLGRWLSERKQTQMDVCSPLSLCWEIEPLHTFVQLAGAISQLALRARLGNRPSSASE